MPALQFADTILKKYSSVLGTIFTAILSWMLFHHSLSVNFALGVSIVFISMHQVRAAISHHACVWLVCVCQLWGAAIQSSIQVQRDACLHSTVCHLQFFTFADKSKPESKHAARHMIYSPSMDHVATTMQQAEAGYSMGMDANQGSMAPLLPR